MKNIVNKIEQSISGANIYSYTDPLLAIQCIYNHHVDIVFADYKMKRPISIVQFANTVRTKQPDIDLSVISSDESFRELSIFSGADRVISDKELNEILIGSIKRSGGK